MSIFGTVTVSAVVATACSVLLTTANFLLTKVATNVGYNMLAGYLSDRQKAFFRHYRERHPVGSPRDCRFGWCSLIPPRVRRPEDRPPG